MKRIKTEDYKRSLQIQFGNSFRFINNPPSEKSSALGMYP